jgi:hypothetical protein
LRYEFGQASAPTITSITPSTALRTLSNCIVAAAITSGIPNTRNVNSVITPSVPSEPTNKCVKS